jgi:hypothetical protein
MKKYLLTVALLVTALVVGLAVVPASAQAEQCPNTPTPIFTGGASATFTQDGVTISWSGSTVMITGGSVTFCLKGGTSGTTGIITKPAGTYTTLELGLVGPQGQGQEVSHGVVYAVTLTTTPPPPPPPTTTTTTPPTTPPPPPPSSTTTPPPTTTTVPPPGNTPPSSGGPPNSPNTPGTRARLAFTGPEDALPIALLALALLAIGIVLLRKGWKAG